jgi:hypothetical protein
LGLASPKLFSRPVAEKSRVLIFSSHRGFTAMTFQPTSADIHWASAIVILTGVLTLAERAWRLINKILNDCQRRKDIAAKRKEQLAERLTARLVPIPKAAIGAEKLPSTVQRAARSKSIGKTRLRFFFRRFI